MPVSTGIPSYVLAEVESSDSGRYKWGHYMITLADCRRKVDLEFFLSTAPQRKRSLAKIDLLLEVLAGFRAALAAEAELIADVNGPARQRKQTKPK